MKKKIDIVIIGAGGFGREVLSLVKTINKASQNYNILGFIDDGIAPNTKIHDLTVLGDVTYLLNQSKRPSVVFAIGNTAIKKEIVEKLKGFVFETIIHPSIRIEAFQNITIGEGVVICEGTHLTSDISIGDYTLMNLNCSVGHDTIIKSFTSIMPGCSISGEVEIGEGAYLGTGTTIINQVKIGEFAILGAGAVVIDDIPANCTAVGAPAKPIKFN